MRKLNAFLSALLVCALFLTAAQAAPEKEEIVYAVLDDGGKVEKCAVVNEFEAVEESAVADWGTYDRVVNLSGTEELPYENGRVMLTVPQGRFRYEGGVSGAVLPWDIRVEYALNGEKITAERLAGGEGELQISLDILPRAGMERFTDLLTLQITMELDGDLCASIRAEKATMAAKGAVRTLAFVLLPGQEGHYTVSASVRDFYMNGLQIAGVKMAIDKDGYKQYITDKLGSSPLAGPVAAMFDNFAAGAEAAAPSFSDERNGDIRAVQFVIVTRGVPAPQKEAAEPENDGGGETLLDRIKALF